MEPVLIFIVAALALWVFMRQRSRSADLRALVRNGRPTMATVTGHFRRRLPKMHGRYYLTYRFEVAGQIFTRSTTVSLAEYREFARGDDISVIYDPQDPQRNRTRSFLRRRGYI